MIRVSTSLQRSICLCPSTTTCTGASSSSATRGLTQMTLTERPACCTWTP
jgi:hypothetical protein